MDLLTGEPLALDLLNTRAHTPDGDIDALDDPRDFAAWLEAQAHRLTPPDGPLVAADLTAVRRLREHVEDAVERAREGRPPHMESIEAVNRAVRAAPAHRMLTTGTDGALVARQVREGAERPQLLAQLADAAVDLLTDPGITKVRRCEAPDCRMLFLPAHPRRRWCSAARCGNRVRVRRYYRRHSEGA
ncbi:hypothetical protein SRB5_63640 [Streptomyces sp. RB5]|uniref:Zinc finger CGNR domain-containing protein n=1 Tax=Streptomyces smaragdinus TaxID=2585196 RepID=A0A7K0CRX2_9ACTN|nr:CGNR zinc finger domain-containing protein [Streptomyces smaragdinus]MQY16170.1 hypothetical protein [Streptomyces smaragdinus]